jgi:secondary thiamine-phosphate synthase enzyme
LNAILNLTVEGQGLYDITHKVQALLPGSLPREGLVTLYIRHTSASLLIQENADPQVLADLQQWMHQAVPEDESLYTHTQEGPDDMPAHIKSALTATSVSIPLLAGELALGTWQGIFLWEHRHRPGPRQIIVNVLG